MNPDPRYESDYTQRQIEAAHRVLMDVGQVLASFGDCMVVVGGWVPDLLIANAEEPHLGSIDVDFALDAAKLNDGRYADLLKLLIDTKRYRKGSKDFQLVVDVDLKDGGKPVQVDVEFIAPKDARLIKNKPKLFPGFRVLQAEACSAAFKAPQELSLKGKTVRGADNSVALRVASVADFLVMKAHAIGGRDKPKDSYDLCYCLDYFEGGMKALAADWRKERTDKLFAKAIDILKEKFDSVDAFGPQQVVEFHNSSDPDLRAVHARRAYELVRSFLTRVG